MTLPPKSAHLDTVCTDHPTQKIDSQGIVCTKETTNPLHVGRCKTLPPENLEYTQTWDLKWKSQLGKVCNMFPERETQKKGC